MPNEKILIHSYILDSHRPFALLHGNNFIHQEKRITMRKYLHNHRGVNYFIALRNITGGYPPKLKARLLLPNFLD